MIVLVGDELADEDDIDDEEDDDDDAVGVGVVCGDGSVSKSLIKSELNSEAENKSLRAR